MLTRGRIDICTDEVLFDRFACVHIFEDGDLTVGLLAHGQEFPAEVNLDSSFLALIKRDLVRVWECIDEFVGSPELDARAGSCASNELILSQEALIVEGVEIGALALVRHSGRVVDVVTTCVDESGVEVAAEALLFVKLVHKHIVGVWALVELSEALNELALVVEASS